MKIIWMDAALSDLRSLRDYIAADNPSAAIKQVSRIVSAARGLVKFPGIGRPGRCHGSRELVIGKTPYIVAYRLNGKIIEILRVLHGRRRWPKSF